MHDAGVGRGIDRLLVVALDAAHAVDGCVAARDLDALGTEAVESLLAGEYEAGPRLMVTPIPAQPHNAVKVRDQRRRSLMAAAGHGFMWCTLEALTDAGIMYDIADRALAAVKALTAPVVKLASEGEVSSLWGRFKFGQTTLATRQHMMNIKVAM